MNEILIAYLLHETPEDDRAAFAEKWFADPDLHEQLRMAEAELLDAYVREDLNPDRRRRIERYLLQTADQREKLRFAQTLRDRLSRPSRKRLWLALVAAACLAGAGTADTYWLLLHRQPIQKIQTRVAPQPTGSTFALTLPPDTRGVAQTQVSIPPDTRLVSLELQLDPADRTPAATVEITRAGRLVWTQTPVPNQTLYLPAALLTHGQYELKLTANGSTLAYYHLTIAPSPQPLR